LREHGGSPRNGHQNGPADRALGARKLIPYVRNPRTHSDAQIAQIAASIAEFGFNNPILVDTKAGIIAGHGRLLAARKLQLNEVPVIVLDHPTEAQKRAYILADNRLTENAGWDEEALSLELQELSAADFDLNFTGFSPGEIDALPALPDEERTNARGRRPAPGTAERDAAMEMGYKPAGRRVTLGGDRGYDTRGFVEGLRSI